MQHADEIIRALAPERHARIGGGQDLLDDLMRRQVGVDGAHLGAMHHHVRDMHDGQIEHAAEHVARAALDRAFLMQNVDGALQLVVGRHHGAAMAELDAGELQHDAHEVLDAHEQRPEDGDEEMHEARHRQGKLVGMIDRQRLRQHLCEDEQQTGHEEGRVDRAILADEHDQHAGHDGGAGDVEERVAEQQRRDHAISAAQQLRDDEGAAIALLLERMHMREGRAGQRRLGAREERRKQHAAEHDEKRRDDVDCAQRPLPLGERIIIRF